MVEERIVNINDLQRLMELDLLHLDQNLGKVTVAYPYSGFPKPMFNGLESHRIIPYMQLMPLLFYRFMDNSLINGKNTV